jgi:serpin B
MTRFLLPMLIAATAIPAADSLPPALNAFTTAAYKQLDAGDGNLILSPFNIATALSMALAGARGQTASEMQTVLHLKNVPDHDAALGSLLASLTKAANSGGNELHTANALWAEKGLSLQPAFEKNLDANYHAPLTPLDFIANPEAARAHINQWTEDQTKNKIQNLLPSGSVNPQTRLVLTSAIYFYGKWQQPFISTRTQPAPFTLPGGKSTEAKFMNQTSHFGYAEVPGGQILEMAYAASGIAFDVVLPTETTGLPALEKSLTPEKLTAWLGSLASRNVQVSLPKFRTESEFSLNKVLPAMGMPTAFSAKADFSGIDPKGNLAISEVVHKAFVDVSEQGTEAAAATGVAIHATAMRTTEQPVIFRADHPFLFLIRDTKSGSVLFMGRLMNPSL